MHAAVSEVKPPSTSTRKHNLGPKSLYTFHPSVRPSFQLDETKDFHFKNEREREMGLDGRGTDLSLEGNDLLMV